MTTARSISSSEPAETRCELDQGSHPLANLAPLEELTLGLALATLMLMNMKKAGSRRFAFHHFFLFFIALPAFAGSAWAGDRVVLVGDSTVASYSSGPKQGWGHVLQKFFDSKKATIINLAQGGRSSRSFRREGLWQDALDKDPKYILIQFGHNDSKRDDRYTAPNGEYKENLRDFVEEARKNRAIPILVTPPVRLVWSDGKIRGTLTEYVVAMKAVASEKNVAILDLDRLSAQHYEAIGKSAATKLFAEKDGTHTNSKGALILARMVAQEIRVKVPGLGKSLK